MKIGKLAFWRGPREPVGAQRAVSGGEERMELARIRKNIEAISRSAADVGREAADVRGMLDDAQKAAQAQTATMAELAGEVDRINQSQQAIEAVTRESLEGVAGARAAVAAVSAEFTKVKETLHRVGEVTGDITQIALQTRLLSFNAAMEAHRAGEAGRGFGAVANAVRDLAARVEVSTKEIKKTLQALEARIAALALEIEVRDEGKTRSQFHQALVDVDAGVARIASAAQASRETAHAMTGAMAEVERSSDRLARSMETAGQRSEVFLRVGEGLMELLANSGVETADSRYIAATQVAAARISAILEEALDAGAISQPDLFDERYQPIAGTDPQQFMAKNVALAERLFPAVQEAVLSKLDGVVFCIAVDRNGYIPMHNKMYSQPQGHDPVWNAAHCRNRRIFDDRTGITAARNTKPFLLQTYRRDMGGGKFVLLKEACAPITVRGRHWGGMRLAYHFQS